METNNTLAQTLIKQCKQTKSSTLDLGYCGLQSIPKEVFELTWLEELQLSNSIWDYEKKKSIHSDNMGKPNLLASIPSEISQLKQLKLFSAGGGINKYGSIVRWEIEDISLIRKGIPVKWERYASSSDIVIKVEGCPLVMPPTDTVKEGNAAILNYFEQIAK